MSILTHPVLIIDCQTTGTHPKNGHLLQIGWCVSSDNTAENPKIEKWVLKPPIGYQIPPHIKKMQQLQESDLANATEPGKVYHELQTVLLSLGPNPIVIAHYAQFELAFLKAFYLEHAQNDSLNFTLLCTQKMTKRLIPNLPSYTLKGLAGYLQLDNTPKNEVLSHVQITLAIWNYLQSLYIEKEIHEFKQLVNWLDNNLPLKQTGYNYNIDRLRRLDITNKPGVYFMRAKDKSILYIGKATSLKSRVNSYFRGVKKRNKRSLEMLAQVWEIETIDCTTPLEAALVESDAIKKWKPPYNILLKSEQRTLIFYNREFTKFSLTRDTNFCIGPFKPFDAIASLFMFIDGLKHSESISCFGESISQEILLSAWQQVSSQLDITLQTDKLSLRYLLTIGHNLLKFFECIYGKGTFEAWWRTEKKQHPEEILIQETRIVQKIFRLLMRAAIANRRCLQLNHLYNCTLKIKSTGQNLQVLNGEVHWNSRITLPALSNSKAFDINHYDRLSILLSEKNKGLVIYEYF